VTAKCTQSPEQLAQLLAAFRQHAHLTYAQACNAVGVPDMTMRNRIRNTVPKYAKLRPDLDWSIPTFSGRGEQSAKAVDEKKIVEELREARAKLASYDREYADHHFIKQRLFHLAEETVTPPSWMVKKKAPASSPGIPCMIWSDWHWSEVVNPAEIGGVNEYNLEIAHARVRMLVERTISLLRQYMVSPHYDGIVICLGGDMLSGNIHEELTNTNAVPIMAAVVDLWGVLEWAIRELADEFGKVAIFCVTGNHGRSTHKIPSKQRAFTSFDWLVYAHLQSAFAIDSRVQIIAPEGSDQLFRVYDTKFLLTHGDQFRGGDGMIGHLGPVTRGQKKKLSRNAEIGQGFNTMVIGHWHTYQPGDRIITNGSLIGYNEYASSNNFAFEPPRQALWMVHPERGITYHIPVYVEEPKTAAQQSQWVSWQEAA